MPNAITAFSPPPDTSTDLSQSHAPTSVGHSESAVLADVWYEQFVDYNDVRYHRHDHIDLFPRPDRAADLALQENIRAVGQLEEIVVDGDIVIDGFRRLCAAIAIGHEPRFTPFPGGKRLPYILSKQLVRSHWSKGQRAAIVAQLQDWDTACTHGGRRDQVSISGLDRIKDRARLANVGETTQSKADRVARHSPSLLRLVVDGEIALEAAIAQLDEERVPDAGSPNADRESNVKKQSKRVGRQASTDVQLQEQAAKILALQEEIVELKQQLSGLWATADLLAQRDAEIEALKAQISRVERIEEKYAAPSISVPADGSSA